MVNFNRRFSPLYLAAKQAFTSGPPQFVVAQKNRAGTEYRATFENAIARVIREGKVRTYDMGGKHSTLEVAKAIADYASS